MACPTLAYIGTTDPACPRTRRYEAALRHCGVNYVEFEGLDHTTAGLGAPPPQADVTVDAVTAWLHRNLDRAW
jgi:hypothetical protein